MKHEIRLLKLRLKMLEKYEELINIKTSNVLDVICVEYIKYRHISLVAEIINEKGFELPGSKEGFYRKYEPKDITRILIEETNNDSELQEVARRLRDYKGYKVGGEILVDILEDMIRKNESLEVQKSE